VIPPIATQRAIADYLDWETARIDALIAAKRRMIRLLNDRGLAILDAWVQEKIGHYGKVPLRRLISRVEQGWSPECDAVEAEPDEWGVLKTSAVSSGVFRPEENKRLPPGVVPDVRWAVANSDLLVIRGSGSRSHVGQAAVADVGGRRLLLSDLIYRLRLSRADPDFVAAVMRSNFVRGVLEASIRSDAGQTLKVRGDDLRVLPIPAVPFNKQHSSWIKVIRPISKIAEVVTAIERQINVVAERRHALITEVATGALTIPRTAA
jgi:type I restriction enzyme, S subunit